MKKLIIFINSCLLKILSGISLVVEHIVANDGIRVRFSYTAFILNNLTSSKLKISQIQKISQIFCLLNSYEFSQVRFSYTALFIITIFEFYFIYIIICFFSFDTAFVTIFSYKSRVLHGFKFFSTIFAFYRFHNFK